MSESTKFDSFKLNRTLSNLRLKQSVTFKMASKVFLEETDENFDFITEILFRFLGFGNVKISIVIEN